MKRLLSLLLVIAMLFGVCTVFTACDGSSASSEKEEEKEEKKSNRVKLSMKGVTLEEGVVYKGNGITLTAKEIEIDGDYIEVYFDLENTSSEYRIVDSSDVVVNGISSCGYGFYQSLYGGESYEVSLSFYVPELELLQVKTIGHIDFYLDIYDDYYNNLTTQEKVTVNTSEKGFVHTQKYDGEVLFEKKGIRVTLIETSFKKNETHGMYLLVENENSKYVHVSANQFMINGWWLPYGGFYANLQANTNAVVLLELSDLDFLGVKKEKDIQNVSFGIWAYDEEYDDIFDVETVSYAPGAEDFVKELDVGEDVLYEDDIDIVLYKLTAEGQPVVKLYIKNNTDGSCSVELTNWTVNGYEAYGSAYLTLPANAQCIYTIYLNPEFKVESPEELDSIKTNLHLICHSNYKDVVETLTLPLD